MIGQRIGGRYQIVQILGAGGFGTTYLAQDQHRPGQPTCVVKHLKPARRDEDFLQTARRLFNAEAEVLEKLGHHERIPRLLAHFEEDQEFFLVEEFIPGTDLSHELTHGRSLPETEVVMLLDQILEVLSYVHQHNVIHRDLKPSNLIRRQSDGQIVLIDFGAVKQIEDATILTAMGSDLTIAIGSPGYLPDEQVAGKPRFASDVYAAGVIGIQALTGRMALMIPTDPSTSELLWRDRIQVSPDLADILDRMVRYDYRDRYSSAQAALVDLRARATAPFQPAPPVLSHPSPVTTTATALPPSTSPESLTSTLPVPRSADPAPAAPAEPETETAIPALPQAASVPPTPPPPPPETSLPPSPAPKPDSALSIPTHLIWGALSAIFVLTLGVGLMGGLLLSRRPSHTAPEYWLQSNITATQTWQVQTAITQMVVSPDGRHVICTTADGQIKLWDARSGEKLPGLAPHPDRIESLALVPGQSRALSGGEDGQIVIWDVNSAQPERVLDNRAPVSALAVSPNAPVAVSGTDQGQINFWSLETGERIQTVPVEQETPSPISSLQISPDGRLLALADGSTQIQVWDLEQERLVGSLPSDYPVDQVIFSPTEPLLVSRSADGIRLWDLETGDLLRHLPQTFASVQSMAISEDGQTLVTGTDFRQPGVKIWNLRTGELLQQLEGHGTTISALALSPDGQSIYSAGTDGEIRHWQVVE